MLYCVDPWGWSGFLFPNKRAILTSKIQSLIISFLSDNCGEMDTLMCELQFYFCLTLYNCHLTRLTNTPASALCSVSTAPPPFTFSLGALPRAQGVRPSCLWLSVSHTSTLSPGGGGETEQEGRWETMVTVGWTSGRRSYILIHYNTCSVWK